MNQLQSDREPLGLPTVGEINLNIHKQKIHKYFLTLVSSNQKHHTKILEKITF